MLHLKTDLEQNNIHVSIVRSYASKKKEKRRKEWKEEFARISWISCPLGNLYDPEGGEKVD